MPSVSADYLVVGAGALGMAFIDALIDRADVDIVLVDRRHAAGGHWRVSKRIRAVTGRFEWESRDTNRSSRVQSCVLEALHQEVRHRIEHCSRVGVARFGLDEPVDLGPTHDPIEIADCALHGAEDVDELVGPAVPREGLASADLMC